MVSIQKFVMKFPMIRGNQIEFYVYMRINSKFSSALTHADELKKVFGNFLRTFKFCAVFVVGWIVLEFFGRFVNTKMK